MGLETSGEKSNWEKGYQELAPGKEILERMEDLEEGSFIELQKNALESEGFAYIPAENIWIDPQRRIIRFSEPEQMVGSEVFSHRDVIEKQWPVNAYSPTVERENSVLRGYERGPVKPFSPHLGGRLCFHEIPVFETKDRVLVPISILPDSGQRYAGCVKTLGSNMLRGRKFPEAANLKKGARDRVRSSLDEIQKQNPFEKIISSALHGETMAGFWTVELETKKGRTRNVTRIANCHVARDPQTGTFDVFAINKRYIFDMEEQLRIWEQIPGPANLKRVMALVDLENFKRAEKGKPMKLLKVFFGEKEVKSLDGIPYDEQRSDRYRHLFSKTEEGFLLNAYKAVPPTEEFQKFQSMVVEQVPEKSVPEMKQYLGQLMEKLVGQMLRAHKEQEAIRAEVPKGEMFEALIKSLPEDFQSWARGMQGKTITIRPEFILKNKASQERIFAEVKYSYPGSRDDFKDQLYRMILCKLINGEGLNIEVFSTEGGESAYSDFPSVRFINVFDKKYRNRLDPKILQEISVYEAKLKRATKHGRP